MKLVRLTSSDSQEPVLVNPEHVASVRYLTSNTTTVRTMDGGSHHVIGTMAELAEKFVGDSLNITFAADVAFVKFWREHGEWSQKTFGGDDVRGPLGPLKHLEKEAVEAIEEASGMVPATPKLHEEIVDCFFLTLDAARRAKLTPTELLAGAFAKLAKNKERVWPPFDPSKADEAIEHHRTNESEDMGMSPFPKS